MSRYSLTFVSLHIASQNCVFSFQFTSDEIQQLTSVSDNFELTISEEPLPKKNLHLPGDHKGHEVVRLMWLRC
jgi:hypothetical protein